MVDWIDNALLEWAAWVRDDRVGLAFSSRAPIGRLIDEGAGAAQPNKCCEIHVRPEVWQTEKAILKLNPRQRKIVKKNYLGSGNDYQKARDMKMKDEQEFLDYLHGVHLSLVEIFKCLE